MSRYSDRLPEPHRTEYLSGEQDRQEAEAFTWKGRMDAKERQAAEMRRDAKKEEAP